MKSDPSFKDDEYIIEKKFLSMGNKYYIKDSERKLVGFCKEKSLKIKGDLRIFDDKDRTKELFRIKQRNLLDFTGSFEVIDKNTEQTIGYLNRNWTKSVVLGEWKILDRDKKSIGKAVEDSLIKEAIRFKGLKKLPYRYKLYHNGEKMGVCKQRLTILKNVYKLQVKDEMETGIDRRLLISLTLLLDAVEKKFRKIGK
ncbi:MAG: hypothetical protein V5A76_02355 [Candidatus Thermoplasmatota archaeon]